MTQVTIDTRFFRAGVGTVIYNADNQIALFERAKNPIGVWQFQQGGIDLGENAETTLWRELKEEIGLVESDFEKVTEMPDWTIHTVQSSLDNSEKSRLGQAHKWYFLKLKADVVIDLTKATDKENSAYRFDTFENAIGETETLKKPVYEKLQTYFLTEVV